MAALVRNLLSRRSEAVLPLLARAAGVTGTKSLKSSSQSAFFSSFSAPKVFLATAKVSRPWNERLWDAATVTGYVLIAGQQCDPVFEELFRQGAINQKADHRPRSSCVETLRQNRSSKGMTPQSDCLSLALYN